MIPTVAPYLLPKLLPSFARRYPQARLTVIEEITAVLLNRLRQGSVDVAILALPVRGHELEAFPLITERMLAAVSLRHPLAKLESLALKELRQQPFLLLSDGHCFRESAVAACARARLSPRVVFESGQFSSLLAMVAAGMGVSIVPEMAAQSDAPCRFLPLKDDKAERTIATVVLRGRSLTRARAGFLSHLRDYASSTASATPLPPPRHSVATPRDLPRARKA